MLRINVNKRRMLKLIAKITGLLCLTLMISNASAQSGIDTALFKQLGVKKMWVYVKLPILPKKSFWTYWFHGNFFLRESRQ